jgi:hypothetical protein
MNHRNRNRRAGRLLAWVLASIFSFAARDVLAVAVRIDSFAPPRKSSTGAVRKGTDLMKVTLDLVQHPDAICNDGSPGVIYVRRASVPADANKWVLYLQGGGSCHSFEECLARWTHKGSNYGAHKMSTDTRLAPAGGVNYLVPPESAAAASRERRQRVRHLEPGLPLLLQLREWTGQASSTTPTAPRAPSSATRPRFRGADISTRWSRPRTGVGYDSRCDPRSAPALSIDNVDRALHRFVGGRQRRQNNGADWART